jgi:hypothetical protein
VIGTRCFLRVVHRDWIVLCHPNFQCADPFEEEWTIGNSRSSLVATFMRTVAIPFRSFRDQIRRLLSGDDRVGLSRRHSFF